MTRFLNPDVLVPLLVCASFFAFGTVTAFVLPAVSARRARELDERCDGKVLGQVVDMHEERYLDADHRRRVSYHPVVEFEYLGRTYRFRHNKGERPPRYRVGEYIEVRFERDDPQDGAHILPARDTVTAAQGRAVIRVLGAMFMAISAIGIAFLAMYG